MLHFALCTLPLHEKQSEAEQSNVTCDILLLCYCFALLLLLLCFALVCFCFALRCFALLCLALRCFARAHAQTHKRTHTHTDTHTHKRAHKLSTFARADFQWARAKVESWKNMIFMNFTSTTTILMPWHDLHEMSLWLHNYEWFSNFFITDVTVMGGDGQSKQSHPRNRWFRVRGYILGRFRGPEDTSSGDFEQEFCYRHQTPLHKEVRTPRQA